jgi:hypothetical protein
MSFVEGIGAPSFSLADPTVMFYVCIALILVCVLLDAPAIASAWHVLQRKRRFANSYRTLSVRRFRPDESAGS